LQLGKWPKTIGDLRIEEWRDEALHRYLRAAKLFADEGSRYSDVLPELLDVRLISMGPQRSRCLDLNDRTVRQS
jgi:hypothetical protein